MTVKILYCGICGGKSAAELAAVELKTHMGLDAALVDVGRGKFEVFADDDLVFSLAGKGRHPRSMELVGLLRAKYSGKEPS